MRYVFIQQYQTEFRIKSMARVLGVSRSGFYAWRRRRGQKTASQQRRELCDTRIANAFNESKGRYGARRLRHELMAAGECYNRKTIAASLRRQGLKAKAAKKFKVTTDSKHKRSVAPNLLQQDFTASAPNQKWVGDMVIPPFLTEVISRIRPYAEYAASVCSHSTPYWVVRDYKTIAIRSHSFVIHPVM